MTEHIAAAKVHGRYLTVAPRIAGAGPILAGFHGYAEDAEIQLERLLAIPGSDAWLCVSIQALHPFYRRSTNEVVSSWMTTQTRELAIADNLAWVESCLAAAAPESAAPMVFAGFSQGAAMAWRAAVNSKRPVAVIAVGGDIPPEITRDELKRVTSVLLFRGASDWWYTAEKLAVDRERLGACGVNMRVFEHSGGHEWSVEVTAACADFLAEVKKYLTL